MLILNTITAANQPDGWQVANYAPLSRCWFCILLQILKLSLWLFHKIQNRALSGRGFLLDVIATGFEPVTVCLEGRCSIQLSYATIKKNRTKSSVLSGWQDSNLRPPAPKAGAMTGLRYTPRCN